MCPFPSAHVFFEEYTRDVFISSSIDSLHRTAPQACHIDDSVFMVYKCA